MFGFILKDLQDHNHNISQSQFGQVERNILSDPTNRSRYFQQLCNNMSFVCQQCVAAAPQELPFKWGPFLAVLAKLFVPLELQRICLRGDTSGEWFQVLYALYIIYYFFLISFSPAPIDTSKADAVFPSEKMWFGWVGLLQRIITSFVQPRWNRQHPFSAQVCIRSLVDRNFSIRTKLVATLSRSFCWQKILLGISLVHIETQNPGGPFWHTGAKAWMRVSFVCFHSMIFYGFWSSRLCGQTLDRRWLNREYSGLSLIEDWRLKQFEFSCFVLVIQCFFHVFSPHSLLCCINCEFLSVSPGWMDLWLTFRRCWKAPPPDHPDLSPTSQAKSDSDSPRKRGQVGSHIKSIQELLLLMDKISKTGQTSRQLPRLILSWQICKIRSRVWSIGE